MRANILLLVGLTLGWNSRWHTVVHGWMSGTVITPSTSPLSAPGTPPKGPSVPVSDAETTATTTSRPSSAGTTLGRRSLIRNLVGSLGGAAASVLAVVTPVPFRPAQAETGANVRGTPLTPFNGLAFQYRGSDFGGLTAEEITEPSISYSEFIRQLQAGEVERVEFLAPNGDVAYATFKKDMRRLRIGEGYPIEQSDGWSSPTFAIRAVKNAGVPYKFIVPALQ